LPLALAPLQQWDILLQWLTAKSPRLTGPEKAEVEFTNGSIRVFQRFCPLKQYLTLSGA